MKRFVAVILCMAVLCGLAVFPVRAEGTDLVIDARDSMFPTDTTVSGDLILTGDCPETVILINVTVQGTLRVEADHAITVRFQGDSRCEAAELTSNAELIGGEYGSIVSRAALGYLKDGSAGEITIDRQGGVFHIIRSQVGTLTMDQSNILAGGAQCQAETVVKNEPNCLFSGTCATMEKNYDPEQEAQSADNYGVEATLTLESPTVSPAASVIRAKLTFTSVPENMAGDYRLYWYFGDMFSGNEWHFTVEEGAVAEFECSVHFDDVMDVLPIWAELTDNSDSDVKLRYVTQVQVDYSTAEYKDSEYSAYPYEVHLLRNHNVVIIYGLDEKGEYTKVVNVFVCSVGVHNPTPTGEFEINYKARWGSLMLDLYGQYVSQFNGNMLFHSVPYRSRELFNIEFEEYNKLGTPASSGCVRLSVSDAMWIYDHCRQGTKVQIYDSDTCPVEKPVPIIISEDSRLRGWDPTDPYEDNPTRATNVPEVTGTYDRMTTRIPAAPQPC